MPVVPVDDKGTVIYYEDTGAPKGLKDYTTLVLIHGFLFHGVVFRRLLPYAETHNLRIIRLNWRDYPNSTPYSSEEMGVILDGDGTAKSAFMQEQGHQLARFLLHFAQTENIPKVSEAGGTATGGMAVLSWSMSNMWTLSLLGNARLLPDSTRELLGQYLRKVILYDPVISSGCGKAAPPAIYHPLRDPKLSDPERVDSFRTWIAWYNTKVEDISQATTESILARKPLHEGDTPKLPTTLRMTEDEVAEMTYPPALRSSLPITRFPFTVFRENFEHALLDTQDVWPNVKVLALWGNESVNDCILAAKIIYDIVHDLVSEGETKTKRNIEIHAIDGGNHFPHWDIPETVVNLLARWA